MQDTTHSSRPNPTRAHTGRCPFAVLALGIVSAFAPLSFPSSADAACFDYDPYFQELSTISLPGAPQEIVRSGDWLYIAATAGGVAVVNISNPATPVLAATIPTVGNVSSVTVRNGLLFAVLGSNGVAIFSLNDPDDPLYQSTIPGPSHSADAEGEWALVAMDTEGVAVVNILDPTQPSIEAMLDTPSAADRVVMAGDRAYVLDRTAGFLVVDISFPGDPYIMGQVDMDPGFGLSVTDHVWVTDFNDGLLMMNVDDPVNPWIEAALDLPGYGYGLAIEASRAYVSNGITGLHAIDITNPVDPIWLGSGAFFENTLSIATQGTFGFVGTGLITQNTGRLVSVSLLNVDDPTLAVLNTPGLASDVALDGDHAYIADGFRGLSVADISNPLTPVRIAGLLLPGTSSAVGVRDPFVYIGNEQGRFTVIDVTNPATPIQRGSTELGGTITGIDAEGSLAYVAHGLAGMAIVSAADPDLPSVVGTYNLPNWTWDVELRLPHAFVCNGSDGLKVLNVANPAAPFLEASIPTQIDFQNLVFREDWAIVAAGNQGLAVFDVTNVTQPIHRATIPLVNFAADLALVGDFAYVADGRSGLQIVNISDPPNPARVGGMLLPAEAWAIAAQGSEVYVATGANGMHIVPVQCGSTADAGALDLAAYMGPRLTAFPSPAGDGTTIQFNLREEDAVRLEIVDVQGRRVRSLFAGVLSSGAHSFRWDLRADDGRPMPAGAYLSRGQFSAGVATERVVVLRR